jgi:hypothetical protein
LRASAARGRSSMWRTTGWSGPSIWPLAIMATMAYPICPARQQCKHLCELFSFWSVSGHCLIQCMSMWTWGVYLRRPWRELWRLASDHLSTPTGAISRGAGGEKQKTSLLQEFFGEICMRVIKRSLTISSLCSAYVGSID